MKTKSFSFLMLVLVALIFNSCATKKEARELFVTPEGAINGYDVVAYFTEGTPVKGDKKYSYTWNYATWLFATENNLTAFKSDPKKYAPQYGGYCAYGTAEGHKAPTQPDAWTIVNGKLYLNYSTEVKGLWMTDQQNLIDRADKNWDKVKKQ